MTNMTNCNCECFCDRTHQDYILDDCSCCVCDYSQDDNSQDDVPYVPRQQSQQEIERELAAARASVEFYQNKINMLDRQTFDYEWKLNYYHGMLSRFRQNIFELYIALENAV
jgi:hypothetical protein